MDDRSTAPHQRCCTNLAAVPDQASLAAMPKRNVRSQPAQLSRSQAAVDLNSERLVADVLNSANKQLAVSSAGPADRGGTSAGGAPPGVGTPASGAALGGGFGGAANHHHQHHAYHSGTAHGSSRPGVRVRGEAWKELLGLLTLPSSVVGAVLGGWRDGEE